MTTMAAQPTSRRAGGLKQRFSSLVKESAIRGLVKSKSRRKAPTSGEPLSLEEIHQKLQLPNDLKAFNFDYSDGESFRYSFNGSDHDLEPTSTRANRFSFGSSALTQLDVGKTFLHQVIPDTDDESESEGFSIAVASNAHGREESGPQEQNTKTKLLSHYGIDDQKPQGLESRSAVPTAGVDQTKQKREPLSPVNRQISARPLNTSSYQKPTQIAELENYQSNPLQKPAAAHYAAAALSTLPAARPREGLRSPVAHSSSTNRYSMPPSLNVTTSISHEHHSTEASPKRRFEVKMDSLLKPVGARDTSSEARKAPGAAHRTNLNYLSLQSVPNTPTVHTSKRLSLADLREPSFGETPTDAPVPLHSSSTTVVKQRSSLRDLSSGRPELTKRYSTPVEPTYQVGTSAQSTANMPGPARRSSSTSRVADRLAWIKELEEKSNNPGRDMVFHKMQGGVASKLSKLEGQNNHPSGSFTRTEYSATKVNGVYSIEGRYRFNGGTRSSAVGSPVSSPGTVLTNFDESFKEKMESLASSLVDKAQKGKGVGPTKDAANTQRLRNGPDGGRRIPRDVIDMINLTGADTEVAVNDYVGHGNFGRTRTMEEELAKLNTSIAKHARPLPPSTVPTIDMLLNTPPSTPPRETQSPSISRSSSSARKSRVQASAARLSIVVAASNGSASPTTPERLLADINSPPCLAAFSTLSREALPLAKDERTPYDVPVDMATGSPASESFNPAALPLFIRS